MRKAAVHWRLVTLAVAFFLPRAATAADPPDKEKPPTAIEKNIKALNDTVSIKIDGKSLAEAVELLHDKTNINFVLDAGAIEKRLGWRPDKPPMPVKVDLAGVKVKSALRTILSPYSLSYSLVGDAVLIADEETVLDRQLSQPVDVDISDVEFPAALKLLGRENGANFILDSQLEGSKAKVSLRKKNVPLMDAVQLLAGQAGADPLRVGNMLYVTDKKTADKLRSDPDLLHSLLLQPEVKDRDK